MYDIRYNQVNIHWQGMLIQYRVVHHGNLLNVYNRDQHVEVQIDIIVDDINVDEE